ncbi:acetyltransferase (GNAT) family protein [Gillisia mitskevichiae]|uniref:Acetyltransferase (GNAT) family protein n=2 Tax=Gillisia mitskevichiae TaxID=270921 RepID=A0A495PS91_9FLAO|nr:acetyltransferase (GNAT) family protein [Gillisia mitskevichiae]
MMIRLIRTTSEDPDFVALNILLDNELTIRDGEEHEFFDQYNKIDSIKNIVLAYFKGKAVGCGAIKNFDKDKIEIKRMFVLPEGRGNKIASQILTELETWAKELGYKQCILETGISFKDAIGLYHNAKYKISENYGQYAGVKSSVCFSKVL